MSCFPRSSIKEKLTRKMNYEEDHEYEGNPAFGYVFEIAWEVVNKGTFAFMFVFIIVMF